MRVRLQCRLASLPAIGRKATRARDGYSDLSLRVCVCALVYARTAAYVRERTNKLKQQVRVRTEQAARS